MHLVSAAWLGAETWWEQLGNEEMTDEGQMTETRRKAGVGLVVSL